MNKPIHKSPLVGALLSVGRDMIESDLRERMVELQDTPLGGMLKAALRRKAEVESEGRKATEEDVRGFLDECRRIAKGDDDCQD